MSDKPSSQTLRLVEGRSAIGALCATGTCVRANGPA